MSTTRKPCQLCGRPGCGTPRLCDDCFDLARELEQADGLNVCHQFARAALPWIRGPQPELDLAELAVQLIASWKPDYWAVECSSISRKWLTPIFGRLSINSGGHAVWTNKPVLVPNIAHHKERLSGKRPELRAEIPYALSAAFV